MQVKVQRPSIRLKALKKTCKRAKIRGSSASLVNKAAIATQSRMSRFAVVQGIKFAQLLHKPLWIRSGQSAFDGRTATACSAVSAGIGAQFLNSIVTNWGNPWLRIENCPTTSAAVQKMLYTATPCHLPYFVGYDGIIRDP